MSTRPVLVESSHALPLVSFVVAFETGSYFDPVGREGLARFTGRMLRRGAGKMSAQALEAAIDRLGAELSVEVSSTSVAVHAQVIRRNLEPFVKLVAEVLGAPTFDADEIERLRKKALAEVVEARDNDRSLAQQAFRPAVFGDHPYARTAHGRPKTLAAITQDEVKDHFARHYLRENATFGFAGDIRREEAERIAAELLQALPSGKPPSFDALVDPKGPTGRTLTIVDKPERTQTQIIFGGLGSSAHDDDHVPLVVATSIFGGTFTSRLMREVRSKRGWSYGASARISVERVRHAFSMWTFPAATDAAKCAALELELLEKLVADGVTPRETSFVKNYLVRSHAFEIDTPQKRLHQELDTRVLGLPDDYHTAYLDKVKATTTEAANLSIKKRISVENLAVVVVGTAKEIEADLRAAIPGLRDVRVVPFDADD